ncbi:MAG: hypothetical protein WB608_01880, partial [Terracidiphilus sp.]
TPAVAAEVKLETAGVVRAMAVGAAAELAAVEVVGVAAVVGKSMGEVETVTAMAAGTATGMAMAAGTGTATGTATRRMATDCTVPR